MKAAVNDFVLNTVANDSFSVYPDTINPVITDVFLEANNSTS